jgi:hypothetical protein
MARILGFEDDKGELTNAWILVRRHAEERMKFSRKLKRVYSGLDMVYKIVDELIEGKIPLDGVIGEPDHVVAWFYAEIEKRLNRFAKRKINNPTNIEEIQEPASAAARPEEEAHRLQLLEKFYVHMSSAHPDLLPILEHIAWKDDRAEMARRVGVTQQDLMKQLARFAYHARNFLRGSNPEKEVRS